MYKNKNAFSLIELSIVLIIIGLLVAGITGGKSLIDSARNRAFVNELEGYRKAFYIFKTATGRLPGDLDNDGYAGTCYGLGCPGVTSAAGVSYGPESYPAGSFSSPYNAVVVNYYAAPYVDLYLEKIIDFKPAVNNSNLLGINTPYFKAYKFINIYYTSYFGSYLSGTESSLQNIKPGSVYISLSTDKLGIINSNNKKTSKPYKYVDEKTDDGDIRNGSFRAYCEGSGKYASTAVYDDAINDKDSGYCYRGFYRAY